MTYSQREYISHPSLLGSGQNTRSPFLPNWNLEVTWGLCWCQFRFTSTCEPSKSRLTFPQPQPVGEQRHYVTTVNVSALPITATAEEEEEEKQKCVNATIVRRPNILISGSSATGTPLSVHSQVGQSFSKTHPLLPWDCTWFSCF